MSDYDMMLELDFRDRSFFYLEAFQAHFPGVSVAFDIRNNRLVAITDRDLPPNVPSNLIFGKYLLTPTNGSETPPGFCVLARDDDGKLRPATHVITEFDDSRQMRRRAFFAFNSSEPHRLDVATYLAAGRGFIVSEA